MIDITIVVEDGRVQNVFSDSSDILVSVLYKDTQDTEEIKLINQRLEELKEEQPIFDRNKRFMIAIYLEFAAYILGVFILLLVIISIWGVIGPRSLYVSNDTVREISSSNIIEVAVRNQNELHQVQIEYEVDGIVRTKQINVKKIELVLNLPEPTVSIYKNRAETLRWPYGKITCDNFAFVGDVPEIKEQKVVAG